MTSLESRASYHRSVDRLQGLRTGGRWFDFRLGQIFPPRIDDSHSDRMHSSLAAVHCFDNDYVEKQPVPWKEFYAEYLLKELQESMYRCTARRDIT